MGIGLGLSMQILVLIVQNSFPVSQVGTATATNNYFRQVGASLGAAVVGSLFVSRLTALLSERMPASASTAGGGSNSFTPDVVKALPAQLRDVIIGAYNDALTPVFLYLAPLLGIAATKRWWRRPDRHPAQSARSYAIASAADRAPLTRISTAP
jgi:hypothetical protein